MSTIEALRAALAALPAPGEPGAGWFPVKHVGDTVTLPYPRYHKGVADLFRQFNAGLFGFASEDRDYRAALMRDDAVEALGPGGLDPIRRMSREQCLLSLRAIDRAERFVDGSWAAAHEGGLLNALLERLIELETERPS